MTGVRIERFVTSGVFTPDDGIRDVDNNVWSVGDDHEALVVDAAHDADAIVAAVGDRRLTAVVCTHTHDDHVNAAPALAAATGAPILLHLDDRLLWKHTRSDRAPHGYLSDSQRVEVAGTRLRVLHTPGHTPGAIRLHLPDLGAVFTGDTLVVDRRTTGSGRRDTPYGTVSSAWEMTGTGTDRASRSAGLGETGRRCLLESVAQEIP
ncbi:MBL fold metallo-hydrolase [Streptomyces phaeoluteigriseus]|uniref:MBL fold metallo-hydrolase n=1 Tax=Streptomyces phaeoluteigriseus TaxID=114686 RepID=UPI000B8CBC96|nr:MBL fold metallo-hydrolase [Streptomyces phaeoluteigriseus]